MVWPLLHSPHCTHLSVQDWCSIMQTIITLGKAEKNIQDKHFGAVLCSATKFPPHHLGTGTTLWWPK